MRRMLHGAEKNQWKMITLTIGSQSTTLAEQVDFLYQSFRRLRQTVVWRGAVRYGRAILELTYNADLDSWHPHLHCIVTSAFIPKETLSKTWCLASRGSFITDIRVIEDTGQATNYLCDYLGKTPDFGDEEDRHSLLVELIQAMKDRKTVIPIGKLPKVEDVPEDWEEEPDPGDWVDCAPLAHIIAAAERGEAGAMAILHALENGLPIPDPRQLLRNDLVAKDTG
jgi:hypothetical protein